MAEQAWQWLVAWAEQALQWLMTNWRPVALVVGAILLVALIVLIVIRMRRRPRRLPPQSRPARVTAKRLGSVAGRAAYYMTFDDDRTRPELEVTLEWYEFLAIGEAGTLITVGADFGGFDRRSP